MAFHKINVTVNHELEQVVVPSNMTLMQMLRESLALTGTKNGCSAGECGACTVMLNGEPVNSCMVLAVEMYGATIVTVESLAGDKQLTRSRSDYRSRRVHAVLHAGILSLPAIPDRNQPSEIQSGALREIWPCTATSHQNPGKSPT